MMPARISATTPATFGPRGQLQGRFALADLDAAAKSNTPDRIYTAICSMAVQDLDRTGFERGRRIGIHDSGLRMGVRREQRSSNFGDRCKFIQGDIFSENLNEFASYTQ